MRGIRRSVKLFRHYNELGIERIAQRIENSTNKDLLQFLTELIFELTKRSYAPFSEALECSFRENIEAYNDLKGA